MNETWLALSFHAAWAANLLAAGLGLANRPGLARGAGWLALACCLSHALALVAVLGRPPLSGPYETAVLVALTLDALAVLPLATAGAQTAVAWRCCMTAGLVLALFAFLPRRLFPDWYMYNYFWTRMFFLCRVAAVAGMLYGSLAALAFWGRGLDRHAQEQALARSRNLLLLCTALYLAGELAGFTWRLHWLGDYWSWSRNFLEATLFFLLVTAALHLPPRWAAKPLYRARAQAAPGLIMLILMCIHLLPEV